jgi:HEAT repeat protein
MLSPLLAMVVVSCAGNVNDALVEARRGDPEGVKEAAILLGRLLAQKEAADHPYDRADLEAIEYLKDVADKSPDAVNRAIATSSLASLRRADATEHFLRRLDDTSWLVQLEAVKALAKRPRPELSAPLVRKLQEDIRIEVRLEIVKALAKTGGDEALRALLHAFLDRSTKYREMKLATYDGVVALSGESLPFQDVEGWRAYQLRRFPGEAPGAIEAEVQGASP